MTVIPVSRSGRAQLQPLLGGCTRQTLRCADAKSYQSALRPCCRGHIRQIVADTARVLADHDVPWWLDYGSLLGAVRNPLTRWADYPWLPQDERPAGPLAPGIVPHDKDADAGFLGADWSKLMRVRAALERMGYVAIAKPHGLKMKVRLSQSNTTNLDLFGWREKVGGVLFRPRYINVDNYKGRDFPAKWVRPLGTVEWEGITLPAPNNPVEFCAFRYGESWKTPIPANHDGKRR